MNQEGNMTTEPDDLADLGYWNQRPEIADKRDRARLRFGNKEPMRSIMYIGGKNGIVILSPGSVPGKWFRLMQRLILGITWEEYDAEEYEDL